MTMCGRPAGLSLRLLFGKDLCHSIKEEYSIDVRWFEFVTQCNQSHKTQTRRADLFICGQSNISFIDSAASCCRREY